MSFAISLCLALVLPQGSGPAEPASAEAAKGRAATQARVLRHIPIRAWMASSDRVSTPPLGSALLPPFGQAMRASLMGQHRERRVDPDAMFELLRRNNEELFEAGEVELRAQGASLIAVGPPEQVRQIEASVASLTAAMTHPVRLRAALYRTAKTDGIPVVVDADDLGAITEGTQPLWQATATCSAGNVTALANERRTRFVFDIDVEVAQDSKIADPKTRELFEGARVVVEPHVLSGSTDLLLLAQFAIGEQRRPMQLRSTGVKDTPSLDAPSIDTLSGSFSGRVTSGGALVVGLRGHPAGGGSMLLTLTATRLDQPEPDTGVIPVSALLSKALQESNRLPVETRSYLGEPNLQSAELKDRHLGPRGIDDLIDVLRRALGGERAEAARLEVYGSHVLVSGEASDRAAVTRVIEGLQDQWLRTTRVQARTLLTEQQAGDGVFPSAAAVEGNAAPISPVLHDVTFPALLGRPHVTVRGRETTAVVDIDVEIAQGAAISNPVSTMTFSGVVLVSYLYPEVAGVGGEIELRLFDDTEPKRRPREASDGGDLYMTDRTSATLRHRGPVTLDRDMRLGDGATVRIGDRSFRTQQRLRISIQQ